MQLVASAEAFIAATGAVIRHGGGNAYYSPKLDIIQLPVPEAFRDAESYSATKAHELTHWTAHTSRLNRDFGAKRFGDNGYAMEEIVAEMASAHVCADLGITLEPREGHASYIARCVQILKSDKRAIFATAAHAQKAVDYLHSLQPNAVLSRLRVSLDTSLGGMMVLQGGGHEQAQARQEGRGGRGGGRGR